MTRYGISIQNIMTFDYKKEYKDLYLATQKPQIVNVPPMNFIAVRGMGNPNTPNGEYANAMQTLYGIAYTIKMSKTGNHRINGFFDFVVPPLEGFWWQEKDGKEVCGFDCDKDTFQWISIIRLPDFVAKSDFDWAVKEATAKKKKDFSKAEFLTCTEGLCVQCLHIGPYDNETATIKQMTDFAAQQGYITDISSKRRHHEIYLNDARKTSPDKLKTVIRHPIKLL